MALKIENVYFHIFIKHLYVVFKMHILKQLIQTGPITRSTTRSSSCQTPFSLVIPRIEFFSLRLEAFW